MTTKERVVFLSIAAVLTVIIILGVYVSSQKAPETPQDRVKFSCYYDFFYPVWKDSIDWGVAIEKMKARIEWRECSQYIDQFINEEVQK